MRMNILFTILLWILFLMIYLSGRSNKTNIWCAVSGFIFSLGPFKEYFFYNLKPVLEGSFGTLPEGYTVAYSVMTAILYYLATPSALLFALYFTNFFQNRGRLFVLAKWAVFLPAVIISAVYRPDITRYYQLNNRFFWYAAGTYNTVYALLLTILLVRRIICEKNFTAKRQKRFVALIILPALWYWLITIFLIHSMQIKQLFKLWQGNTVIVLITVIFYITMALKEGIMGLKLKAENYSWNSDLKIISRGAGYTAHLLKNETAKINWSLDRLKNNCDGEIPEELKIISRSTQHLKDFINKTSLYSSEIVLDIHPYRLREIILESVEMMKAYVGCNIMLHVNCPEDILLSCDRPHLTEVLNNLISNSAEAMRMHGEVSIDAFCEKRTPYFNIAVSDTGAGINKDIMPVVFEPFFTTKKTNRNFGLGLSYCYNVLAKHNGYIDIKSDSGCGTTVILHFPAKSVILGGDTLLWKK